MCVGLLCDFGLRRKGVHLTRVLAKHASGSVTSASPFLTPSKSESRNNSGVTRMERSAPYVPSLGESGHKTCCVMAGISVSWVASSGVELVFLFMVYLAHSHANGIAGNCSFFAIPCRQFSAFDGGSIGRYFFPPLQLGIAIPARSRHVTLGLILAQGLWSTIDGTGDIRCCLWMQQPSQHR